MFLLFLGHRVVFVFVLCCVKAPEGAISSYVCSEDNPVLQPWRFLDF